MTLLTVTKISWLILSDTFTINSSITFESDFEGFIYILDLLAASALADAERLLLLPFLPLITRCKRKKRYIGFIPHPLV